jgi:hypothetical protein
MRRERNRDIYAMEMRIECPVEDSDVDALDRFCLLHPNVFLQRNAHQRPAIDKLGNWLVKTIHNNPLSMRDNYIPRKNHFLNSS